MGIGHFLSWPYPRLEDLKDWIFPSTPGNLLPRFPGGKIHYLFFYFPLQPDFNFHLSRICKSRATRQDTHHRPACGQNIRLIHTPPSIFFLDL